MASRKSIEAGRATLRIVLADGLLGKQLQKLQAKLNRIGGSFTAFGARASALGGAVTAGFAGALATFTKTGDQIDKIAARTGVAADKISALGFAAEQSGTDLETIERAFFGQSRSLFELGRGSASVVEAYDAIGLGIDDLSGKKPEEQFLVIADALNRVSDASRKGAIAQQIFGRSGRQIIPLLGNVRALMQEADDLNIVMGKESAAAAARFADAWNRVQRQLRAVMENIGAAIAGPLSAFLERSTKVTAKVIDWIQANEKLVASIAAGGALLLALGGLTTAVGFAATAVSGLIGFLSTLATGPVGLAAAALVGLTAATVDFKEAGVEAADTVKSAFRGITDALSADNMQLAAEIFFTAFELEFQKFRDRLLDGTQQGLLGGIAEIYDRLLPGSGVGEAVRGLGGFIDENTDSAAEKRITVLEERLKQLKDKAKREARDRQRETGLPDNLATTNALGLSLAIGEDIRDVVTTQLALAASGLGLSLLNSATGGKIRDLQKVNFAETTRRSPIFDTRFAQQIFGGRSVADRQLAEAKRGADAGERAADALEDIVNKPGGLVVVGS